MAGPPAFSYGGQAVLEGVMIRGRTHYSLAVRRQDGSIAHHQERLNTLFTGTIRRVPLARGVLVLVETLLLGVKALHQSTALALRDQQSDREAEIPQWALGVTMAVPLILGVALFFLAPLLLVGLMDPVIASDLASNVVEGLLRLGILIGYVWGIGFLPDIKRVFAYHGAEHMAVHTYEAGLPLTVANVRIFPTPHPRCGTAFLLAVVLVSIVVFALLGRPSLELRVLSRVLLLPVIAGISYEVIRFSGAHQKGWSGRLLARPGLLLQRLTTREPDEGQVEVAICAMEGAMAADSGRTYLSPFPPQAPKADQRVPAARLGRAQPPAEDEGRIGPDR